MPKGPTLYLVLALVAIAITAGLLIAGGLGSPPVPDLTFTPAPTTQAAAATPTPAPPTATPEAESSATPAPSATRAATTTPAPSATRAATATAETTATSATTATPEAAVGAFVEYTVQEGDTLNAIALRYNTSAEAILALNDIPDPALLTVGTVLRIPGEGTPAFIEHTVARGETLVGIARQYGVTTEAILQVNEIPNPRSLTVGAVLRVPQP